MKIQKRILPCMIAILLSLVLILASCGASGSAEDGGYPPLYGGNDNYAPSVGAPAEMEPTVDCIPPEGEEGIVENPFVSVEKTPVSTFSADVDTASYSFFRKLVNTGYSLEGLRRQSEQYPLRTEEMVNYFDYSYTPPAEGEVFGTDATVAPCPWNENSYLMVLGLTTEELTEKGANNLVFLIDVSGSMAAEDKLPLLKTAFTYLVDALDERDTVSIVTYSGKESTVLSGCPGNDSQRILSAINSLSAKGSTNGESGLTRAYSLAADYFIEGGNNRIIMASDGDLNVGISSPEELEEFISTKRDAGIFLSVLGFGSGNYKDSTMSALAQNGNGVYYYIDGEREAERVLGRDLLSTLYTVAKDVKLQLTFDPAYVSEYRLIGYETRLLNEEDFEDDTKDAGEVGAGHCLTVCYELKLKESSLSEEGRAADWMKLGLRYKLPDGVESTLREIGIGGSAYTEAPDGDFRFAACVVNFTMLINQSAYNVSQVGLDGILSTLNGLEGLSEDRLEFRSLLALLTER